AGTDQGVGFAGGAADSDGDPLGDALGVGHHLLGEVVAHREDGGVQLVLARGDAARAGGQQQHGVVGGGGAVDVEAVEGEPGRVAQRGVELVGGRDGVGGDHAQHRRQGGGEHAGALGHAADVPL